MQQLWVDSKDWFDFSPDGPVRNWPSNGISPDPFHRGPKAALRELLPNGDSPKMLHVDLAHTYAIAGFGKDELASTLVFLSVRCRIFGEGNVDVVLDAAFRSYDQWCLQNKKTTTIKEFSKEELKITSTLHMNSIGFITLGCQFFCWKGVRWLLAVRTKPFLQHVPMPMPDLRLQQFPRGLGKGSDAALVSKWLKNVFDNMDETMVPVTYSWLIV